MGIGKNATTTQTTSANPIAAQAYQGLIGQAQNVAATPYQSYTGQLVAPVNAQQNLGISNINQNAGFATPAVNQALGLASGAANPLTQSQIANYQNPYTQNVVNATQAQFANQNQQQQAQLTGNQISQGALGGNRTGVAAANLANQQQLAQAPVIAGLYNQGYNQALQTAAQQYQQNPMAAAQNIANFGISGQNAALAGAGAQIGAGTLQQQTQQAQDTAAYNQFLQQQAYPFQTAQWLAGLEGSIGPQLGGTSQTVGPSPNTLSQVLGGVGAGVGALGSTGAFGASGWLASALPALALSDERTKENIKTIGKTHDGQSIYRFNYKGSPVTQIGLMAQDVEKNHPEAVYNIGGIKAVDYDAATSDSVRRDAGGAVSGFPYSAASMPWSGSRGYVPVMTPHGGHTLSVHGPSAPQQPQSNLTSNISGLSNLFKGNGSATMGSPGVTDPIPVIGAAGDYPVPTFVATGGKVSGFAKGYADGGMPTDFPSLSMGDPAWANPDVGSGYAVPVPETQFAQRWADLPPSKVNPEFLSAYEKATGEADPRIEKAIMDSQPPVPLPVSRPADAPPVVAQDDDEEEAPKVLAAGLGTPAPSQPFASDSMTAGFSPPVDDSRISKNFWPALMAAGFGMMASRSPYFGVGVGEGALTGLNAFNQAQAADQKAVQDAVKMRMEQARVDREAAALQETIRHNQAIEAKEYKPSWSVIGERVNQDTGLPEKVYGWVDPNKKAITDAQGKPISASMSPSPTTAAPVLDSEGKPVIGTDALASMSPQRAALAKQIGDYKVNPNSLSVRGGHREQAIADATRYNPDYDQRLFTSSSRAMGNFYGGPEGRTIRSLNVAIDHLNTLDEAAKALKNSDFPALNRWVNFARQQTGSPLTTNFDSIKQVVSAEIAKAVVGGQTALHDRDDMAQRANAAQGPEQLAGIITEFKKLMAGQMKGLRKQYEVSTRAKNFDDFLEPTTKRELEKFSDVKENYGGATSAPPKGAIDLLRQNPALALQFDAKYGAGAAQQYLGGPQ